MTSDADVASEIADLTDVAAQALAADWPRLQPSAAPSLSELRAIAEVALVAAANAELERRMSDG